MEAQSKEIAVEVVSSQRYDCGFICKLIDLPVEINVEFKRKSKVMATYDIQMEILSMELDV